MSNSYPGLDIQQKNKIIDYYRTQDRPAGRAKAVKWASRRGQYTRFKVLKSIGDLAGKKVLDVGSGLGDFFHYLQRTVGNVDYTGIDIVPEFVEQAKEKYPEAKFLNKELAEVQNKFDYVLASGSLSKKIPNHKLVYGGMIKHMYGLSTQATGFNMLNEAAHEDNEIFCAYNPNEILAFCKEFAKQAQLVTGYLKHDFTIFLYH